MDKPEIETEPSLRGYLELYAAGFVGREEMLSTVASWPFQEERDDKGAAEPDSQDNTLSVISCARLLGRLTRADVEEIQRRLDGPLF